MLTLRRLPILAGLSLLLMPLAALADVPFPVDSALQLLQGRTTVPIYLPNSFPADDTLYLTGQTEPDNYYLTVDLTPDCAGATACNVGFMSGERNGYMGTGDGTPTENVEQVTLANGVTGQYVNVCGAYCSATLQWENEGIVYTVYVKNGDRDGVLDIANSALEAGAR